MTKNKKVKSTNFVQGVLILSLSTVLVKVIGALFKIPLTNMIGELGMGYFNSAYQIYMPLYTIATAGFPVAVAKLVSQNYTLQHYKNVRKVYKVALSFFTVSGIVGSLIMFLCAKRYSVAISSPNSIYPIIVMSPTVLFCCLMSCYRGYYEGLQNMFPTAISQLVEALCRLFLGLYLSKVVLNYGIEQFGKGNTVFGQNATTIEDAINITLPFSASGAVLGVTIGSLFGFLFLMIYHKIKGDSITQSQLINDSDNHKKSYILRELYKIAIPVCIGALVLNVGTLIDVTLLQNRLGQIKVEEIRGIFTNKIPNSVTNDEIVPYLYGCYTIAQNIALLVPTISQSIAVSSLPAVTKAWSLGNKNDIKNSIEIVLKISSIIAFPTGLGLVALSQPVLNLLYSTRPNGVIIATPLLQLLGISAIFTTLSVPINSMLQAVSKTLTPVKLLLCGIILKIILSYILISIPYINLLGAGISSIACYLVVFSGGIFTLIRFTKIKISISNCYFKPLFCAILSSLTAYYVYIYLKIICNEKITTIISIFCAIIVYSATILLTHTLSQSEFKMLSKNKRVISFLNKHNLLQKM